MKGQNNALIKDKLQQTQTKLLIKHWCNNSYNAVLANRFIMIYITYRRSVFDDASVIHAVWDVKYEDVTKMYIAFMQKKAETRNIVINPHWLNIMNHKDHNSFLTEAEYKDKSKEWKKELKQMNINKFISEILKGKKLKFEDIHQF